MIGVGQSLGPVEPARLFVCYSTVILSFLAGTLWTNAQALAGNRLSKSLLVASNAIALLACFSLLLADVSAVTAIVGLSLGYVVVLGLETHHAERLFPAEGDAYLGMRSLLTSLVLLIHVLVAFFVS